MVSQSKLCINIALSAIAVLMSATTSHAQVSSVPKRHRNKQEFGRKQGHQRGQRQQRRNEKNVRMLDGDSSMPLQDLRMDLSMPLGDTVRMMSLPLQDLRLDLSMPLQDLRIDLSMPTEESVDGAITLDNGSDSDGSPLILASFLAGISALAVGLMAFFVKLRQKRQREAEGNQEAENVVVHGDMESVEQGSII
mmetsp:Transcript_18171/g.32473  ORF Transcript_18171/g.32473 Transcript_18171/m.32473 type:complete len:194 (+) Transcript_18171:107-688(+)